MRLHVTQEALQLPVLLFFSFFSSVFLKEPAKVFFQYFKDFIFRRVWPVSLDTLEKRYVRNAKINLEFRVWKHDVLCALEKIVMVEVSGHTSKHVIVISVFHDVNSTLWKVTSINHKAEVLLKVDNGLYNVNVTLFMGTSILNIPKSTRNLETRIYLYQKLYIRYWWSDFI